MSGNVELGTWNMDHLKGMLSETCKLDHLYDEIVLILDVIQIDNYMYYIYYTMFLYY